MQRQRQRISTDPPNSLHTKQPGKETEAGTNGKERKGSGAKWIGRVPVQQFMFPTWANKCLADIEFEWRQSEGIIAPQIVSLLVSVISETWEIPFDSSDKYRNKDPFSVNYIIAITYCARRGEETTTLENEELQFVAECLTSLIYWLR